MGKRPAYSKMPQNGYQQMAGPSPCPPDHSHSINSTSVKDILRTIDTHGWHNTLLRLTASMVSQGQK